MKFAIDELVLYGSNGVCRIADIQDLDIGTYYILKPVHEDRTKLMVPAKNENLVSRMRSVPSAESMDSMIQKAAVTRTPWIQDSSARRAAAKDAISSGDELTMLVMVKQLSEHHRSAMESGKKFTTNDVSALHELSRHLDDELSVVYGINPEDVAPALKKKFATVSASVNA